MALIETSLIWVAYAVCLGILFFIAGIFVFIYQKPGERNALVTIVCFITVFALLATILLMPVDIALTSSTTDRHIGAKKEWATPDKVDSIVKQLMVVYYILYTLDAVLCLLVVPFTYFFYEEYDEVAAEEGTQTLGGRLWGALKYTIAFIALIIILFLVGFFVPVSRKSWKEHKDLDYFKDLLRENHGERALTFAIGILILIGTIVYCLYTAPGLALLPVKLIKTAPRVSAPQIAASASSQLAQNRERQRQLEGRNEGREGGLEARDRRELESLVREERTLVRRERLAREGTGQEANFFHRVWMKICAIFRPLKLVGGLIILVIVDFIFVSMLITCIDKIKNSVCSYHCGYLLGKTKIFNPVQWVLIRTSKIFPIDYIFFLLLVVLFFSGSVVGLSTMGIRFLWVPLFKIRQGKTTPNAMLIATGLLTLMVFALNYSLAMIVAPHYVTWGAQTYCDRPLHGDEVPDCTRHKRAVRWCSERTDNKVAQIVCTPSVVSSFLNRITTNFPWLGNIDFWAQFAFLGIFLIVFIIMLFRVPRLNEEDLDDDLREEEEEGLLGSTSRRFGASWENITGRAKGVKRSDYGTVAGESTAEEGQENGSGEQGATGRDSNW